MMLTNPYAPPISTVAYPEFPDYEAIVARMNKPPIFANELSTDTKEGQAVLNSLLYTRYQGDVMNSIPTCSCGDLTGGYNKGLICEKCNTKCLDILDKPIESELWLYTPEGIDKFISPGVWINLSRMLTKSSWNLLEWFVNPSYPDPDMTKDVGKIIHGFNLEQKHRNLNFFYKHYDELLRKYVTLTMLRKKPRNVPNMDDVEVARVYQDLSNGVIDGVWVLLNTPLGLKHPAERKLSMFIEKYCKQPNRMFTKYLPLPSGLGVILETNNTGTWMDVTLTAAADAMYAVTQMSMSLTPKRMYVKNKRSVVCTKKLAEYSKSFLNNTAGGKEGEFRRHVFGGRLTFSMRCVIVSSNEGMPHDGLILPWGPSVQFFKMDILNKLHRRGYTPRRAMRLVDDYTNQYHPLIDEIFEELLAESEGGIWVTFQRPPSLKKGSMDLERVMGINKDASIYGIYVPVDNSSEKNLDLRRI